MRIALPTMIRLPSDRAQSFHIAKVVDVLQSMGNTVDIFTPYSPQSATKNFQSHYGLSTPVRLHHLGRLSFVDSYLPAFVRRYLTNVLFPRRLSSYLRLHKSRFDVLYTRSLDLLPYLTSIGRPIILEVDRLPLRGRKQLIPYLRQCRLIVALTSHIRQELLDMRIASVPIMTEGDAVDLHDFEGTPPRQETRQSLGIPEKTPLIAYVGQLEFQGLSRGIPELLKACEILRMRGRVFRLVLAGGPESAVRRFQQLIPEELRSSITFLGRIPHMKVPTLLQAADILVYPAPEVTDDFYRRDVSPLALFEYMASGIPIVSADLIPLHDVISPAMVTLVPPGDPSRLADGVEYVLDHPEDAARQAAIARSHVADCTWLRRMERIIHSARL